MQIINHSVLFFNRVFEIIHLKNSWPRYASIHKSILDWKQRQLAKSTIQSQPVHVAKGLSCFQLVQWHLLSKQAKAIHKRWFGGWSIGKVDSFQICLMPVVYCPAHILNCRCVIPWHPTGAVRNGATTGIASGSAASLGTCLSGAAAALCYLWLLFREFLLFNVKIRLWRNWQITICKGMQVCMWGSVSHPPVSHFLLYQLVLEYILFFAVSATGLLRLALSSVLAFVSGWFCNSASS